VSSIIVILAALTNLLVSDSLAICVCKEGSVTLQVSDLGDRSSPLMEVIFDLQVSEDQMMA
jgi:hypothetical protein